MAYPLERADYKNRQAHDRSESACINAGTAAVVGFLQLLGRAAHQFHTYPPTSPLCADAIETCHRAFIELGLDLPLNVRVAPRDLILEDEAVGRGTIIEQELSRPLHRARVASIEIERAASLRDWSQFCLVLAGARRAQAKSSFAELLLDAGVGAIIPRMTPRPEVIEIGAPHPAVQSLVDRERTRQSSLGTGAPAKHLYPPDKGWIRVDPTVGYESISLLDLAVLVNDPAELAATLARLIDDDADDNSAEGAALEQRYGDIVLLIGSLDPRLGQVLFSKLARAVLDMDSDRRRALLRRAILPGLLDGRLGGDAVLGEFPDVDLAEALCLLLDLEAASPELLPLALDRLRLPADRRTAMGPLIQARMDGPVPDRVVDRWAAAGFDRNAGALIRIAPAEGKRFDEFAAFDLSMNEQTGAALAAVRGAIAATEGFDAQLACALSLARIEPNPAVVAAVLARSLPALRHLARAERWDDLTRWIARLGATIAELEPGRPDVATAIRDALLAFCGRDLVLQLARLCAAEPGRTSAATMVAALGPSIVPAWMAALAVPADRSIVRPLAPLLSSCARAMAPAIVERLPGTCSDVAAAAVSVLGFAGAGFETPIAGQVLAGDERRTREALRALARIGSAKAAALIVAQIENGPANIQVVAEEALWRFPAALALSKTRELLGRRHFVKDHPQAATRLLDRAAQNPDSGFTPLLESLATLRFHFWSPAIARVGAKARELLQ